MDTLTFEQLPAGVSLLLLKIEQMEQAIRDLTSRSALNNDDDRLSADGAAAYLGCSKLTVMKAKKAGKLPYHQFGKILYFKASELDSATLVEMDLHIDK